MHEHAARVERERLLDARPRGGVDEREREALQQLHDRDLRLLPRERAALRLFSALTN